MQEVPYDPKPISPSYTTVKLPNARPASSAPAQPIDDDSVFVKGHASISYENLPKPEVPGRPRPVMLIVTCSILILALLGGGYYYFIYLRH